MVHNCNRWLTMSDPCQKADLIDEISRQMDVNKASLSQLSDNYKNLVALHRDSTNTLNELSRSLTANMISAKGDSVTLVDHEDKLDVLFGKFRQLEATTLPDISERLNSLKDSLYAISGKLGDVSLSELDKRLAISENILRGLTFVAGGFALAIIGITATALYGG